MLPEHERAIGEAPLAGRVRETGTRVPLPAVAVAVVEAGIEVTTDDKGRFSVPAIDPAETATNRVRAAAVGPAGRSAPARA